MVDTENFEDLTNNPVLGTPLAEVFSVYIDTKGKECELYGTIEVRDHIGSFFIYQREEWDDTDTIKQNGSLSLINSRRAISASGPFDVILDLKDNEGEFINWRLTWEDENFDDFDKCLVWEISGNSGSAKLHYIVHSVAAEAIIVAHIVTKAVSSVSNEQFVKGDDTAGSSSNEQLMKKDSANDGDGGNLLKVYGTIVARYKKRFDFDSKDQEHSIIVFKESFDTAVEVEMDTTAIDPSKCMIFMLPLTRFIFSVPCYSSLSIEVNMFGSFSDGSKQAWTGEVEFEVHSYRSSLVRQFKDNRADIILALKYLHYYAPLTFLECAKEEFQKYGVSACRRDLFYSK